MAGVILAQAHWPAGAQQSSAVELEQQFESAFQAALDLPEELDPVFVLQAWSGVLMTATMADRTAAMESGQAPTDAEILNERVLSRWQEARPEAGGPDLFRTFHLQDPEVKRAAILDVAARHPGDALVVWQALHALRAAAQTPRAIELAESFLGRRPEHPLAYRLLQQAVGGNQTMENEILVRWAEATPSDPHLIGRWLGSSLPAQQPERTHRLIEEFLAGQPTGDQTFLACQLIAEKVTSFREHGLACVGRLAGDAASSETVVEKATSFLVRQAARDGEWGEMLDALDRLDPVARRRALINAAGRLDASRCQDRVELLAAASEVGGDGWSSIAGGLRECASNGAARDLFSNLLRSAPAAEVPSVLSRWVFKVNGIYRGDVPEDSASVLEQRLAAEPEPEGLFRALDILYQLSGSGEKRFGLLKRWYEQAPDSFRGEQAVALAQGLAARGDGELALGRLEEQLDRSFEHEVAETLWQLHLALGGELQAAEFASRLAAENRPGRRSTGEFLAARSASLRGETAAARDLYRRALDVEYPRRSVAIEWLATFEGGHDQPQLAEAARSLCSRASFRRQGQDVAVCASALLAEAGHASAAADSLGGGEALPEDPSALKELARSAAASGREALAERALRALIALDPENEAHRLELGALLADGGHLDELLQLLDASGTPPSTELQRLSARALMEAGEAARAIDLLHEARAGLADSGDGAYSRGWIDHELTLAYQQLGRPHARPAAAPVALRSSRSGEADVPEGASPDDLLTEAEALLSGSGGRYDPDAGVQWVSRAARHGDGRARLRWAILQQIGVAPRLEPPEDVGSLHRASVTAVEELAKGQDAYARYLLGTALLIGLDGREDMPEARRLFELAAPAGESWAWHNLGWMAATGLGQGRRDPAAASEAYLKASEAGNVRSMLALARLHLVHGPKGPRCEQGLQWLQRAAQSGHAGAAAFLGKVLFYGRGDCVEIDARAALPMLETAYQTHQPGAAFDLGLAHLTADPPNAARAETLLLESIERGEALAAETLALARAAGTLLPRDQDAAHHFLAEAARLGSDGYPRLRREARLSPPLERLVADAIGGLEALAAGGDPAAAAWLAHLGSVGLARDVSEERVVSLARSGAEAGEALAMRVLAGLYRRGEGVQQDVVEADRWRRLCAGAGNSFCQMGLGQQLIDGTRVPQNTEDGLRWLKAAAEAGNWWAITDLGRLFAGGRQGIPADLAESARWWHRLAAVGDDEATGWLLYHEGTASR